jgi:hypothetical protein
MLDVDLVHPIQAAFSTVLAVHKKGLVSCSAEPLRCEPNHVLLVYLEKLDRLF